MFRLWDWIRGKMILKHHPGVNIIYDICLALLLAPLLNEDEQGYRDFLGNLKKKLIKKVKKNISVTSSSEWFLCILNDFRINCAACSHVIIQTTWRQWRRRRGRFFSLIDHRICKIKCVHAHPHRDTHARNKVASYSEHVFIRKPKLMIY